MLWVWIGATVLILMICIVCMSNFEIRGVHVFRAEQRHVHYELKALFGLVRLEYDIPFFKFLGPKEGVVMGTEVDGKNSHSESEKQITLGKAMEMYRLSKLLTSHVDGFLAWLSDSLARIKCVQLSWNTEIGTGNASSTAILSGMIWGTKSSLVGFLANKVQLISHPQFNVVPKYNSEALSTELIIVMNIRVYELLQAGGMLLIRILRVKGGLKIWRRSLFK